LNCDRDLVTSNSGTGKSQALFDQKCSGFFKYSNDSNYPV